MLNPLVVFSIAFVVSTLDVVNALPLEAALAGCAVITTFLTVDALTFGKTTVVVLGTTLFINAIVQYYGPPMSMLFVSIPNTAAYVVAAFPELDRYFDYISNKGENW
jgi:hypothetical protein